MLSAGIAISLPAMPLFALLPPAHAASGAALLFGVRLAVDASATALWPKLLAGRPALAALASAGAASTPLGTAGRTVLAAHALLVCLPNLAATAAAALPALRILGG